MWYQTVSLLVALALEVLCCNVADYTLFLPGGALCIIRQTDWRDKKK